MKTPSKINALLLASLFCFVYISYSQEYMKMERKKHLQFENESETTEVKINVTDEYNFFKIGIECFLNAGEMLVELRDPKGNLRRFRRCIILCRVFLLIMG